MAIIAAKSQNIGPSLILGLILGLNNFIVIIIINNNFTEDLY